ncbi:hypothetical protein KCP75_17715 [Salmonella enterica subsp. enterica]|nr:hypothetical protein KCP75_17715 [Salmonella enterica subsp. enterica]
MDNHVIGIRVDIGAIQDEKFDRLYPYRVLTCSLHQLLVKMVCRSPMKTRGLNRIEDWLDEKGKTFPDPAGAVTQQGWRDFVSSCLKRVLTGKKTLINCSLVARNLF